MFDRGFDGTFDSNIFSSAGLFLALSVIIAVSWPYLEKQGIINTNETDKNADEEAPTETTAANGADVETMEVRQKSSHGFCQY